jgi:glycyl-tRNA synthetase
MGDLAKKLFSDLDKEFACVYDDSGSIGRRYRRMDEVGTSFCITVDHDSLTEKDVTLREISSMKQTRVKISELKNIFRELLNGDLKFEDLK